MITKEVNTETKVTTGTLKNAEKDFINFISKKVKNNSKFFEMRDIDSLIIKNEYTAKVKCSNEDEFSEEEGKNKVKFKVLDKYYKAFDKKVKDVTIDSFRLSLTLLEWIYNHVSDSLGDSIVLEIAKKTGYIISNVDDFEYEEDDDDENE